MLLLWIPTTKKEGPMKGVLTKLFCVACTGAALTWMGCASDGSRQSTGEYIDSATITAKVKAGLIDDPVVKAFDIHVKTYRDVVQLNGFVDNPDQKKRAEEVAWGIEGVKGVQNNLTLKSAVRTDKDTSGKETTTPPDTTTTTPLERP
jgi:hyperosmotically inducible periplasmic protein